MGQNEPYSSGTRISLAILLASLLLLSYMPLVMGADDRFEENDQQDQAAEIDYGYYDELTVADDDEDWYRISLSEGDDIIVTITFDGNDADIDLELYNDTGDEPIDGSYGVDDQERVSANDVEVGWYYICVFSYDSEAPYDMDVTDEFMIQEGVINVAQAVVDGDWDSTLNDATFQARIEGDTVPGVNLTIFDNLNNEVASGITDASGEWTHHNLTNGDYHWSAEYNDQELDDSGEFDVASGVREVQGYAYVTEADDDDDYNDVEFWTYDEEYNGAEDVEFEIRWASNDTLYASGSTDEEGEYRVYDLPLDNYTFTLTFSSDTFNSGWFHSYGGNVSSQGDDRFEENDRREDAAQVDYGFHDELYCQDDDWYEISLDDGDDLNVTIRFDGDDADLDLELFDSEGNYIDGSYDEDDDETVEAANVEAGWYYIRAFPFDGRANYTMSITDEVDTPEGIINVGQAIYDMDDDSMLNDCYFWAHVQGDPVSGVNLTIHDDLGNEIASGRTNQRGYWYNYNMTNGEYNWTAKYYEEPLDDEGEFDIALAVRDVQIEAYLDYRDRDGAYNDKVFWAYDENGDGVEGVDVEIRWASNDTYYGDGVTDSQGDYVEQDLPLDNFTFTVTYQTELFNTGWFHSYGDEGGGGETDEWFEDWGWEAEDTGSDGRNDTILVYYDPDTEAIEMDIYVYIWVYQQEDLVDLIVEDYTIHGTDEDWFRQNWTADETDMYNFSVELYDDEWNYEDHFDIEGVYLHAEEDTDDKVINIAQRTRDGDDDGLMNDCFFWAHIEGVDRSYTDIAIYDSLGNLVANGTTDYNGYWEAKNLTNGDYNWSAEYEDEPLPDNGTFDVSMGLRDIQGTAEVRPLHRDGKHDDVSFSAYDQGGEGVQNIDIEIRWASNDTYYSDGQTDGDGEYNEENLPRDNFTFTITSGTETFNTGWFHSYGSPPAQSDEWFADHDHDTHDSGDDGQDDTIRIMYDPDTTATEMEVTVVVEVYYRGNYYDSIETTHTIRGEFEDWFSQEWTTDRTGDFDFEIFLYDENNTQEDFFGIENVTLTKEEGGGGNQEPEATIDNIDPDPAEEAQEVEFQGHGTDSDGTIEGYEWRSDLDGLLSEGASFSTDELTVGDHIVSFRVQDDDGAWSDWVTVDLEVQNVAPEAIINDIDPEPADEGEAIDFEGYGEDVRGDIEGYEWRSDLDGLLASTATFSTDTLSVGEHTISFRVQDDEGEWSPYVTDDMEVENMEPEATIDDIGPSPAAEGESVTFQGSGEDVRGEIVAYQWRSNRDGDLSAEATFEISDLAVGNHRIYLKVKDDEGVWSDEVYENLQVLSGRPIATIDSITPSPATIDDTVTFEGSGSDPNGYIIAHKWRIDGVEVSSNPTFTRAGLTEGYHSIEFLVQDDDETWSSPDTATLEILPGNQAPTATIDDIRPNPAHEGEEVFFEGSGEDEDGDIEGYEWQIDGVILSTDPYFSEEDLDEGTYTVSFRVQDDQGLWSEPVTMELEILKPGGGGGDDDPAPGLLFGLTVLGLVALFRRRRVE